MDTSSEVEIRIRLVFPPGPVVAQLNNNKKKTSITKTTDWILFIGLLILLWFGL
jgi:hypothetical protein